MASFTRFGNDLYSGVRSIDFIKRRRLWYLISAVAILASILIPILRGGYQFGIEFTGGSQFTVPGVSKVLRDDTTVAQTAVQSVVSGVEAPVSKVGTDSVRVQTTQLNNTQSEDVARALGAAYKVPASTVDSSFIGPSWGQDITGSAVRALVIFLVLVALVMAVYFRTWKMALAGMVALFHDLIITAGVYGIVGFEVTPAAVIGFLTILGYSLYDTVVVFDKVRENTSRITDASSRTFAETVNLAVNQTIVRSINTSIVALLPIASILFIGAALLGAGTLRDIALALFIGILVGTYSTIFIAAPLYTDLRAMEPGIRKRTERLQRSRQQSVEA